MTSVARHGTARHGTTRYGTARHGTARHGTVRHGTARHGVSHNGRRNGQNGTKSVSGLGESAIRELHGTLAAAKTAFAKKMGASEPLRRRRGTTLAL